VLAKPETGFQMAVILIVEDEFITREFAGVCIEDWGHQPLFAESVEEALGQLKSDQTIDALFTDINLDSEVLGGCDVARQAQAIRPDLPVLYTTGNSATPQLKSQFVTGSHFLEKPYTPRQLHTFVDAMLAS
jgi:CheY-like chemotaxis protein